jgi:hypothetical protein
MISNSHGKFTFVQYCPMHETAVKVFRIKTISSNRSHFLEDLEIRDFPFPNQDIAWHTEK